LDHSKNAAINGGVGSQPTFIDELGLYSLIMRSSKVEAVEFQEWVFHVIKSIRKTGTYSLNAEVEKLNAQIAADQPKITEFNQFLNHQGLKSMRDTASAIFDSTELGRNKLMDLMRKSKLLDKHNMPYQNYIDRGYFVVRQREIEYNKNGETVTHYVNQPFATVNGMRYLSKKYKKESLEHKQLPLF
jgi:phage antirepressor YoqD-like protein